MKSAIAVRHVPFEDLGAFAPVLRDAGFEVRYRDAGADELGGELVDADLLVVLGGPIGAYQEDDYPFLVRELELLARRLDADRPTLGICLGAQLMARALGAPVYPGPAVELGWAPLSLTPAGCDGPLRHVGEAPVLHWHGDTFDLPAGCERLAATAAYPNQAFARGRRALALQFHLEVTARGLEQWLIGHACELAQVAGVSPNSLRADAAAHAKTATARGATCLAEWLRAASPP